MPTKKQRFDFAVDPKLMADIEEYRFSNKCGDRSKAIRELIEKGLAGSKGQGSLSGEAMRLARAYDGLDVFGQRALEQTAERERERMELQQEPVRRPLAARDGKVPLDLSALQPISLDEVEPSDLDI